MPNTYPSDIHRTTINFRACDAFLGSNQLPDTHRSTYFYQFTDQIRTMTEGTGSVWYINRQDMEPFRNVMTCNDDASRMHTDHVRKATKYSTKGKLGECISKSTGILEVVSEKK